MIKFYLFLLVVIINHSFCSTPNGFDLRNEGDTVFFTLPGQGACNVFVKKISSQNVAIVLDAGVHSTQTHVKFISENTPSHFLCPARPQGTEEQPLKEGESAKKCTRPEKGAAFFSPPRRTTLQPLIVNKVGKSAIKKLAPDIMTCQKETVSVNLGKKLKTLLAPLQVTQMLVFLSHTDKDHINLIGHLPDVPAIFCVGENVSPEKDTYLRSLLDGKKHAHRFDTYSMSLFANTSCSIFLKILLDDNRNGDLQYFKDTYVLEKLNFLHVWLLNPHKSDANSQSYIISATLEQQNMTMVFAGDATTSTFKVLKEQLTANNSPSDDIIRGKIERENHNVLLSLPHHGSHCHFPKEIFNMFKPSAYLVSSGNGACYPHPHKDLVGCLEAITESQHVENFWRSYTLTADSAACTFTRTTTGVGKDERILPILRRNTPNKLLILGTNISGAIYLDQNGIFSQDCNNSVEIEGKDYSIEYNRHAFSGYLDSCKFQVLQWTNTTTKAKRLSCPKDDAIIYSSHTPYAKIYYSPVSKKWLGYLLTPVKAHNRME